MLFPIKQLIEGRGEPLCARKNTTVREALSMMVEFDFSQLPIIDEQEHLVGIISESSIINTYYHIDTALSLLDLTVDHCMTVPRTISPGSDIFDALNILEDDYALVVVEKQKPVGILTDYDTTRFFRNISEGLIIVEDIEVSLRQYITSVLGNEKKLDAALMLAFKENKKDPERPAKEFNELSFNDHIQLISVEKNWDKFDPFFAPKELFLTYMDQVRNIRNQLAHFRSKLNPIQLNTLIYARNWLSGRPKPEKARVAVSDVSTFVGGGSVGHSKDAEQLHLWLVKQHEAGLMRVRLPINQIEELNNRNLPDSARNHQSWWTNDMYSHPHSASWIEAGWIVDDVDLTSEEVTFRQTNLALYQPFFTDLLARLKGTRPGIIQAQKAYLQNWFSFGAGVSGYYFGWVLPKEPEFRVELYIDVGEKDANKAAFNKLMKEKEAIEAQLGAKLHWTPLPKARASRIYAAIPFSINHSQEEHEKAKEWGLDMMLKFIDVFRPRIRGL